MDYRLGLISSIETLIFNKGDQNDTEEESESYHEEDLDEGITGASRGSADRIFPVVT